MSVAPRCAANPTLVAKWQRGLDLGIQVRVSAVLPILVPVTTPHDVMERYRSAFVRRDIEALLDCFAFPVQIVGTFGSSASVLFATKDEWRGSIQNLLNSYERLGVTNAVPLSLDVSEPLPGTAVVALHWQLQRADGSPVYDFRAAYTLAWIEGNPRIVAIAHDELSKLRAASTKA
jgi:Domain of unknown function (DUF4440)